MPSLPLETKRQAAREVIDILAEISTLLNTHLDRSTLSLCVSLIENGVNPEALAVSQKNLDGMNHGNGTRANDLMGAD